MSVQTSPSMQPVNTKQVIGRRTVHYGDYDDLLADAERLAAMKTQTLGNWSFGQIMKHMADSICVMIDGNFTFTMPAPVQFVMRLLLKKKMLTQTLSPGFKLPKKAQNMVPGPTSTEVGLSELRAAVARAKAEPNRAPHPGFGVMGPGEWDEFQLRHCEMHMSFVVPVQ